MRKTMMVLITSIFLAGCSQPTIDNVKQVDKLDNSKAFVYVEKDDELDIKTILTEAGREADLDNFIYEAEETDTPSISKEKRSLNESIRINIDSEDAMKLNEELKSTYEAFRLKRIKASENITSGSLGFVWDSQYMHEVNETDTLISFSVYSAIVNYPGSRIETFKSYTFTKEEGKQLTNQEVLAQVNTTLSQVKAYIQDDFEKNTVNFHGKDTQRNLVDEMTSEQIEKWDMLFYRIQEENGVFITDSDVYVVLELYLAMQGDFIAPTTYRISLSDLTQ